MTEQEKMVASEDKARAALQRLVDERNSLIATKALAVLSVRPMGVSDALSEVSFVCNNGGAEDPLWHAALDALCRLWLSGRAAK